jgi:hypothetical protein
MTVAVTELNRHTAEKITAYLGAYSLFLQARLFSPVDYRVFRAWQLVQSFN